MLSVDEFESQFRSADKVPFRLAVPEVQKIVIVTDLGDGASISQDTYLSAAKNYARALGEVVWVELADTDYDDVDGLLKRVEEEEPDLICAYRNLKDGSWRWPYSLGVFLNVLTRETRYPVLILPNPHEVPDLGWKDRETSDVMVVTDHLAGDDALVNWGVRMTAPNGTLWLTHVEDDVVFARYIDTISRVPSIDTENAREEILKQLLKEPRDYIRSVRSVLEESDLAIRVEKVVRTGHRVRDYRGLLEENAIDLLAFHTNSEDQVALHGAVYLLAIELRDKPILMI
ncbi:MAG: hypothetical protein AAGF12_00235 [Myxococcota bacterium]